MSNIFPLQPYECVRLSCTYVYLSSWTTGHRWQRPRLYTVQWDLKQVTSAQNHSIRTVWSSDSLFGRRRPLRSRGGKLKPGGMTLPQLELWDRGRWAWGEILCSVRCNLRADTRAAPRSQQVLCQMGVGRRTESDKSCLGGSVCGDLHKMKFPYFSCPDSTTAWEQFNQTASYEHLRLKTLHL